MKSKAIIISVSILAFIVISVSAFGLSYSVTGALIRSNPDLLAKFYNNTKIQDITDTGEANKTSEINESKSEPALTKEVLDGIYDGELEQAIVGHIWTYKVKEDYDKEYQIIKRLPQELKYLYATCILELEVNDGGFISFLDLNKGNFTSEAIAGYRFFGADEQADIVAKAVGAYFKKGQRDFKELNNQFYKNEDKVTGLRIKYIREHLEKFTIE